MATYRSYTSYFGSYTVNESGTARRPPHRQRVQFGQVGTDFQRFLEFPGKRLILEAAGDEKQRRRRGADDNHVGTVK